MEKKKTNFNVKVDEIIWDEFKLAAKKRGLTKEQALEIAFSDFIKKQEGNKDE